MARNDENKELKWFEEAIAEGFAKADKTSAAQAQREEEKRLESEASLTAARNIYQASGLEEGLKLLAKHGVRTDIREDVHLGCIFVQTNIPAHRYRSGEFISVVIDQSEIVAVGDSNGDDDLRRVSGADRALAYLAEKARERKDSLKQPQGRSRRGKEW